MHIKHKHNKTNLRLVFSLYIPSEDCFLKKNVFVFLICLNNLAVMPRETQAQKQQQKMRCKETNYMAVHV